MRRVSRILIALFFCTLVLGGSLAAVQAQTNVTVDLTKMEPDVAAKILESQRQRGEVKTSLVTADKVTEWVSIGPNVAKAIAEAAKALSLEVNEFINTPVGRWSLILIVWYVVGKDLFSMAVAVSIWAVITMITWHSFRIFHVGKMVDMTHTNEGGKKKERVCYDFHSNQARVGSVIAHVAVFIIITVVMLVKVL